MQLKKLCSTVSSSVWNVVLDCRTSMTVQMAAQRNRITAPQLEQFVVVDVQLTGVTLGAGAYGSVEEVEIPGARVAAKKLHTQLINLGSPQQVF